MYFDSLHAVLTMEGHGAYVWTAYLVSVTVIVLVLIAPLRRRRRTLAQLAGELRRNQNRGDITITGEP
ncbi:MAG: heme exporter protein CcmD [Halioglobus sp.]